MSKIVRGGLIQATLAGSAEEPIEKIRDQIIKNVSDFVGEANRHDDLSLIGAKVKAQS